MAGWLRRLQPRQRLLLAAFLVLAAFTAFVGTRAVVSAIYWSQHRGEPIRPWMSIGYVAHSYRVPPWVLQEAAGIPVGRPDRRPLADIAAGQGRPVASLIQDLEEAIVAAQPPNPPPPSSPPDPDDDP